MLSFSLADAVRQLAKTFERAEKQEGEREANVAAQVQMLCSEDENKAISAIRAKELEARSSDEKKIVAIDVLLRPEAYGDISTKEAEEMQYDPLYTSDLSKSDAERVLRLPEKASLALPFLHTQAEIEAHRLMNRFYRGRDTYSFEREDFFSEGDYSEGVEADEGNRGQMFSKKQIEEAESVHEMILRELRRDRIRARKGSEDLTQEERDWLEVDRILCPEMFADDGDDEEVAHEDPASPALELTASVLPLRGIRFGATSITTPHTPGSQYLEGDKYAELRDVINEGGSLFEEGWRCPYSRDEVLSIRSRVMADDASPDLRRVKHLLEKYFVSEDESLLGHQRLEMMRAVTSDVRNILQRVDAEPTSMTTDAAVEEAVTMQSTEGTLRRLWGSWEQIHPASGGLTSQVETFRRGFYSPARDHPAAYAIHSTSVSSVDKLTRLPLPPGADLLSLGLATLKAGPGESIDPLDLENDPRSEWYIVESLRDLAGKDKQSIGGKKVLVTQKDVLTLLDVKEATLESRQSRSHHFDISDSDAARVLSLTVSIVFQGTFSDRGYKLGRLAASLFRIPTDSDPSKSPLPRPVGFSPYELLCPNSPTTLGRVTLIHRPKLRPLRPGGFQIIVGVSTLRLQYICLPPHESTCRRRHSRSTASQ